METRFLRNIGLNFDACSVITCKTAKRENWAHLFTQTGDELKNLRNLDNVLLKFDDVDRKLLLLTCKERKSNNLLGIINIDFLDSYLDKSSPDAFINFLSNIEAMKKYVETYYLEQDSNGTIFEKIAQKTSLDSELKSLLYEFFLFPEAFIETIKKEFKKVFDTLRIFYSEQNELLFQCQENFSFQKFENINSPLSKRGKWAKGMKRCFVAFSLLNKYTIARGKNDTDGWLVLGYRFEKSLIELIETNVDIAGFGNAFGDKLRVRIIEELVKNGEMTLADLAKTLGVVNTIAVYHLDILKKENLLLHRHLGRKVLYCLNTRQIDKGLETLKMLCGGIKE